MAYYLLYFESMPFKTITLAVRVLIQVRVQLRKATLQFVHWLRHETRGDVDVVADIPYCVWGAWRCSFAWNNVCGSLVERISLLVAVFRYEAGNSTALCYISLFLGCWNIDDGLVGQLTRQGGMEKISSNGQIRHLKPLKGPFAQTQIIDNFNKIIRLPSTNC